MHWQDFIDIRLNYENNLPRLVTDLTGVLYSDVYVQWLSDKNIEIAITDKISEIRRLVDSGTHILIITTNKDIPLFIRNKVEHDIFTHSDLPLNGDIHSELKKVEANEIIEILNYVFVGDQHQVLYANELETVLEKAANFALINQLSVLIHQIKETLGLEPNLNNVLGLSTLWGKLIYLSWKTGSNEYKDLISQIDGFSDSFIHSNGMEQAFYASTAKNPKTVDKILANIKADKHTKIALLCFDCMGYAEWQLLKDFLNGSDCEFEVTPIFSLLPTITSISRSALFQGNTDVYHLKYPGRATEAKAFANYFSNKETKYFTEEDEITSNRLLGYEYISVLYSFFDELSHSAKFPPNNKSKDLYFQSLIAYLKKSTVLDDFNSLIENDFQIYICSDHGSVVAEGNGKRIEKYLSDDFAKRTVILNKENEELIDERKIKIPFVNDKILVLPEGRTMFANKNKIEINHGGVTIEEMVVPYIKLSKI